MQLWTSYSNFCLQGHKNISRSKLEIKFPSVPDWICWVYVWIQNQSFSVNWNKKNWILIFFLTNHYWEYFNFVQVLHILRICVSWVPLWNQVKKAVQEWGLNGSQGTMICHLIGLRNNAFCGTEGFSILAPLANISMAEHLERMGATSDAEWKKMFGYTWGWIPQVLVQIANGV
jgi:hypothetical protein